jgi:hypothetical protein
MWASTIAGRFPETAETGHRGYHHRLYSFRTRDFGTIGPADRFYEPGFQVIDGSLFQVRGKYAMVARNETFRPEAKHLFLTFARSLKDPRINPTPAVSGTEWAEGPSPVAIGGHW